MRNSSIELAVLVIGVVVVAGACVSASQRAGAPGAPTPDIRSTGALNVEVIDKVAGKDLFVRYCASCHGTGGRGDGPVAAHLREDLPDLTRLTSGGEDEFPIDRVIEAIRGPSADAHGSRRMPVWGPGLMGAPADWPESRQEAFFSNRVARLTEYLESIQAAGDG